MSQNESTSFLVTDVKNLTLLDANRENSPWWRQPKNKVKNVGQCSKLYVGGRGSKKGEVSKFFQIFMNVYSSQTASKIRRIGQ